MQYFRQHPFIFFFTLMLIIALPLFLFPINLFPGEIKIERGLVEITEQAPLSLSYFIGLGYEKSDMTEIKDFYLLTQGYILAFIIIIGIPALAAFRITIPKKSN